VTGEPLDAARALRFLRKLAKNNDRGWFAANRAEYDEYVKPAWEDLVAALLIAAIPYDERFAAVEPRACIFRLARDTRFSGDKTPYKSAISAFLSPYGKNGANAGYYVAIEPGESLFAAGIYTPEKEALQALRAHFAADAGPFARVLRAKALAPYLPLQTDPLVRTPRGLPAEHPQPEWLRARRYMVRRPLADAELTKRGPLAAFRAMVRDCAPLVGYLDRVVSR
jgi:uncharacterized protein (TIGR02453 family)